MTPLISTLVVNLLPALSVVAFGWSAFTLVLLYWIENLIIGGFNVLKILIVGFTCGRAGALGALALTPFFIFHYGLFCFVHGLFIFTMFSFGIEGGPPPAFNLTDLSALVIQRIQSDSALFWNVIQLAAFHLFIFLRYWIGGARWRFVDPFTQMFAPYARIIVVHLTILIAGIPVILLGQPMVAVLCLALLKTGLEMGRMRLFDAFSENPALAMKARRMLKTWATTRAIEPAATAIFQCGIASAEETIRQSDCGFAPRSGATASGPRDEIDAWPSSMGRAPMRRGKS